MIVGNMKGPWYSPHTPLPPGNNHSNPQGKNTRFNKMQKLQTDGCRWYTEAAFSFSFSKDATSSRGKTLFLLFHSLWALKSTTSYCTLYSQSTSRLLFLWKVGLAAELHWGCLSFSNFFCLSLSISIEINDNSLHFQCTSCFLSSEKGSGCRVCSEGASFLSFFSSFCLFLHIFHSLSLSLSNISLSLQLSVFI